MEGERGKKPVNRQALIDAMVTLSKLPQKMPELKELDVNPLMCDDKTVRAVDARIVLNEN